MINFIWEPGAKLPAGTGGSENYTIGQVRELLRRGIAAQIVTVGLGTDDGRNEFVDIPFTSLITEQAIENLEGTVVFVNIASNVKTIQPAFIIIHNPAPLYEKTKEEVIAFVEDRILIVTSKYAANLWADYIGRPLKEVRIVYPFAEPCFAIQVRKPNPEDTVRILFAGRLTAEKGIFTLLEALNLDVLFNNPKLKITLTTAGSDKPKGKIIQKLVEAHPLLKIVQARKTPASMAELMAEQDIVVMPSTSQYWHETFGIVSIEAQHSGCWVVASDDGGLPETNCGGVILIAPNNPEAIAAGIMDAIARGPLPLKIRAKAANLFTVEQSVDNLLRVLFPAEELVVQPIDKIILKSSIKRL
jgi:D-inositol-3-phosphate glycosyltransferase